MTQHYVYTKQELLEALRSSEEQLRTVLAPLPQRDYETGRYENGWNGHQILAHIASIEWTYPRLIETARQAAASHAPQESPAPAPSAQGGIDAYNQRQVDKRAHEAVAGLLAEFHTNRAATIQAVEATDEALLLRPIRSAGGVTGPLSNVLHAVAVSHVLGHAADIVGPGQTGPVT
ncbi:MAG TPA: DinB family protein [Steroidobacteraceae bacterium]|nr:DinB family protein [Steroidobacteraceae bacterium]